jgi:hypothetical protein
VSAVVAVFVVLLVIGWLIGGFVSGLLSAIPVATGVGVALLVRGRKGDCRPSFLRRREQ